MMTMERSMQTPIVLVFEKKPRWLPELQRQFRDESVHVGGCFAAGDFKQRLRNGAPNVAVMDVDAAPAECLQLLGHLSGQSRLPPLIAVGSPLTAPLEWSLRELGVLEFATEFRGGAELARLCRRQWNVPTVAGC
jgi:hypothetical protein